MRRKRGRLVSRPCAQSGGKDEALSIAPQPLPPEGGGFLPSWGGIVLKALARGAPDASIGLATGRCR